MIEIERKILNIDKISIIDSLTKLGAEKIFDGLITTKYFDYPDLRFKKQNELLRVRLLDNEKVELVFKCDRKVEGECGIFNEKQISIDPNEWDNIIDILRSIGFIETLSFEKKRCEFKLTNEEITFELDEYPTMDPLLEIEAPDIETINSMVTKLNLSSHEQTGETISELYARLHPNQSLNGLTFK